MTQPILRVPSFLRRHEASSATDPHTLIGLACDANYWVRRQAVDNPATPRWVIELLVRAGSDAELRGRSTPDPDMSAFDLRRLVECGSWAQTLVADHPNTTDEILAALALSTDPAVRTAVARHGSTAPRTLGRLCCDTDEDVRRAAAVHPSCPEAITDLLAAAGADADLVSVGDPAARVDESDATQLASLGPWGVFLAARQPSCPPDIVAAASSHPDWRVRSALFDNPATPADLRERLVSAAVPEAGSIDVRSLARPDADPADLLALASHRDSGVRLSLARHVGLTPPIAEQLAMDRVGDIRRTVARRGVVEPGLLHRLTQAGSSPDLGRLTEPDPAMAADDLERLTLAGWWARQLAVRHPATPPDALARLLCDDDPKLREWAAVHENVPTDVVEAIHRAGGARDLQGVADPDPTMTPHELATVAELGPWAAWVVAWHPNATPAQRLERHRYSAELDG